MVARCRIPVRQLTLDRWPMSWSVRSVRRVLKDGGGRVWPTFTNRRQLSPPNSRRSKLLPRRHHDNAVSWGLEMLRTRDVGDSRCSRFQRPTGHCIPSGPASIKWTMMFEFPVPQRGTACPHQNPAARLVKTGTFCVNVRDRPRRRPAGGGVRLPRGWRWGLPRFRGLGGGFRCRRRG